MSSQGDANLIHCYNRGCATQKFDPRLNSDSSCQFHPGLPVFHEGYKSWSCCSKKTTDFTTFLNTPGCTRGRHSNEKPAEPVKAPLVSQPEPVATREPVYVPKERPPLDSPLVPLARKVDEELLKTLKNSLPGSTDAGSELASGDIKIGTNCKNAGCQVSYDASSASKSTCLYHSGSPVFHEGMKFWSCCQRKTSDFTQFLSQVGCESGTHNFKEPASKCISVDKSKSCRIDWHQTSDEVVISLFAKTSLPDESIITANAIKLSVHLVFGSEKKELIRDFILFGQIDLPSSHVYFSPNKVEVTLKKGEPVRWSHLELE